MRTISLIGALFCLQFATLAQPTQTQSLRGQVPAAVAGLQPLGRLPATNVLHLAMGLPLRHPQDLASLIQRLYDPASPDYHHYLTPEQFTEMFGPTREDYQAVANFARANGLKVTGTHPNRTLVDVSGSVADVEKAFHVKLFLYPHPTEPRAFFAPDVEPSLDLAVPVLHIAGLDTFSLPRPAMLRMDPSKSRTNSPRMTGSGPDGNYMGSDFRTAYVPGVALTGAGQNVGLLECDGYYGIDITNYEASNSLPHVPLRNVLLDGFNGVPEDPDSVLEVSLDIEMAISMAPGLSSVIVYETSGDTPAYISDLVNRMATDNEAKQISSSWVFSNDASLDQVFQQFATQGQSFFEASGDEDAYVAGVTFQYNDDPYITQVGGTTLTTGAGGAWQSETVWNWDVEYGSAYDGEGSGGGISTVYPIPVWQQGISMLSNGGSTTMRNIPDVAMPADHIFVIADNGTNYEDIAGTSCAAPLWAGFTALVNEQAVASDATTVGFINPAIYTIGKGPNYTSAFHDITTGNNTWSESPNLFYAVGGYDLCAGWGTPAGAGLINLLAPQDVLRIAPASGFTAIGGVGGPFTVTSQVYTLTNAGTTALSWDLDNPVDWLSVSPSSGTLTPGGAASTVTVSLNTNASNLVVGTYPTTLWFTNLSDRVVQNRAFNLEVVAPPVITNPPASQAVYEGVTVQLTVGASGAAPLTFQWQRNGVNLTDEANVSGSATSVLTITNMSATNAGNYVVLVGNPAGTVPSTPPAVLSIILSKPVITAQPASQNSIIGTTVQFSVTAVGNAPLAYQWYFNTNTALTNATNATLTLVNVQTNQAGVYNVLVTNTLGSTLSSNAMLSVVPGSLVLNGGFELGSFADWTSSGNFEYCDVTTEAPYVHSGEYGAALGPPYTLGYLSQTLPTSAGQVYQISCWLYCDGEGPNEFSVSWNGASLYDQVDVGDVGWIQLQFEAAATSASTPLTFGFRDDPIYLGLDDITVYPVSYVAPSILVQPSSVTVSAGATATFSVSTLGSAPLSYFWNRNGAPIAGATASTYSTNNVQLADSGSQFSCLVSNAYGTILSSNATLTVIAPTPATSVAFVLSSAGDPWGRDDDEAALTTVFGTNWQTYYYESVSPAALFSSSTSMIFMEGSQVDASGMVAFLGANLTAMSNWVAAGGSLFINAAPLVSGNIFSIGVSNIYLGFGVTLYPDLNSSGVAAAPSNPIFNGPYLPVGTAFTGDEFSHASLSGAGITPLLTNSIGGVSLAQMSAGPGRLLFGGMTLPYFHSPQPQASNLLENILVSFPAPSPVLTNIATTNDWTPEDYILYFGEPNTGTYGQTFIPPVGFPKMTGFTLFISNLTASVNFQFYVMAWNGSSATGPVLYQSPETSTAGSSGWQPYAFNTGNLELTPGATYVAFASASGSTGQAAMASSATYSYTEGGFFYNNNGTNFSLLTNSTWQSLSGNYDLEFVATFGENSNCIAPTIIASPAPATVFAGGSATFTVTASGTPPLSYFWSRNGVPIAGAGSSSYTTNDVQLADSGSQFSCLVSNACGTAPSSSAALTVLQSNTLLITFDDLPGTDQPVPSNYDGLTWSNFNYLDAVTYVGPSGYNAGVISTNNVAYNAYGNPAAMSSAVPFSLLSAYLTAAWNDNLQVEVQGYNGASLLYDNTYTLSATAPALIAFNYTGVTWVQFTSGGGTPHPGYSGSGTHFVMDNVAVAVGPAPPAIVIQPTNQVVTAGADATFSLVAGGSSPLYYFWYRNGAPIAGANYSSYTTYDVQMADSGSQFSCLVSNAYGTNLSTNATLTVVLPNLVENGGFELGSFADWTTNGNMGNCSVTSEAPYVNSGVYGAELGPVGSLGYLDQVLDTTNGQQYLVSCWLYCDGLTPNEFSILWNGATLFDQVNVPNTGWTNIQLQIIGTTANTLLTFGFRDDPSYFGLDDIVVSPVSAAPFQFQGVSWAGGVINFSWSALAGQQYELQYTTNLASSNWTVLSEALSTTNSTMTATDATTSGDKERFYRIVIEP